MLMIRLSRLDTRGVRVVTNVGRDAMDADARAGRAARLADCEVVWSPRERGRMCPRCHYPRKRVIQYPRGLSCSHSRLWNTNRPVEAGR